MRLYAHLIHSEANLVLSNPFQSFTLHSRIFGIVLILDGDHKGYLSNSMRVHSDTKSVNVTRRRLIGGQIVHLTKKYAFLSICSPP